MAKADRIKKIILETGDLSHVSQLFHELGFPVSRDEEILIIELDSGSFIEAYVFDDRSEVTKQASKHVYQRAGQLAISPDFEEWIFIRKGLEEKIRLQRYKIKRSDLRENINSVSLQRLVDLKYNQPKSFEDLFERKDISNRFYREFNKKKLVLINHISGISDPDEKKLFAQVLLDRLMFLYFLQEKEILDGKKRYFNEKFREYSKKKTDFYEVFLRPLFFEALCKKDRSQEIETVVGKRIPYLNGGLFLRHEVEESNKKISVNNEAFAEIFTFFESWNWNTNERSESDEDAIDPYILGYIFENTLSQNKSGGVYYTPPALSEFLTDETIESHLLERVRKFGISGEYSTVNDFLTKSPESELTLFYETIRDLKILDPACGSGQFLVQALHALSGYHKILADRIVKEGWKDLKRHIQDKGDYHLTKEPIYGIRRFVTANNLYGCDLLSEAAEITKLRLFLAMVEGVELSSDTLEPLPNIDFHIRTGDSLTGYIDFEHTLSTGGKKSKSKKDKNEKLQNVLDFGDVHSVMDQKARLIFQYTMEGHPEKAIELRQEIRSLESRLNGLLNERLDGEMGAWGIKPKDKIDFIDVKKDKEALSLLKSFQLTASELHPFHWGMEFSRIIYPDAGVEAGVIPGFDIVLMNPPWEVWKPNSQEFFERYIDKYRDLDKNQARKAVSDLFKKKPEIKSEWIDYSARLTSIADFFRKSEYYPHRGSGDINLYKLFFERAWNLLKEDGSIGIVIPAGIYSDLGSRDLRRMMFEKGRVKFLYSFENSKALFENVHRSFKFILLSAVRSNQNPGKTVPAAFMLHTEQDLQSAHYRSDGSSFLDLPLTLIQQLSPESMSLMEFKSARDIEIVKKMSRFPRLGEELNDTWNVNIGSEFHSTGDSSLFKNKDFFKKNRYEYNPIEMTWSNDKEIWRPIFEGRMIAQYDSQASTHIEGAGRSAVWKYINFPKQETIYPQFWYKATIVCNEKYKIYMCRITSSSNMRTGLLAISRHCEMSTDSLFSIDTGDNRTNISLLLFMNSLVVDYFARNRLSGNNYNINVVSDVTIPRYHSMNTAPMRERKNLSKDETIYRKYEPTLIENAARLVGTTAAFDALLQEVFGKKASHKTHGETDPAKRQILKNEIDAMVAHIYGLTEEELSHVLSTFPLVEESVKQGVLEEFGKLVK